MEPDSGPTTPTWVDRLALDQGPGTVGRCREFVRAALESHGWPDQRALEDVLLMASEIVTNACRYGGGPEQLRLFQQAAGLRVEVMDANAEPPVLRPFSEAPRVGGHGLRIVDRLTGGRWGCEPCGSGKAVWFEVSWPPSPPSSPSRLS